ncbi:MAG: diguanylate cyclase, partial [Beijerinckiaceae bacterium]
EGAGRLRVVWRIREHFRSVFVALEAHYGADALTFARAKYIYALNTTTSVILFIFVAIFALSGFDVIDGVTKAVFCPMLLMQISLYVVANRKLTSGAFAMAQSLVIVTAVLATYGAVFLTGGFPGSVALPTLILPASITFLLAGCRAGLAMAVATCAVVFVQWFVKAQFGFSLPDFTSTTNPTANVALVDLTVFAIMVATIAVYESTNHRLRQELDVERQRFAALAHSDELTGLENVRGFNVRLEAEITRVRSNGGEMAVLYLDLDHFKAVNDTSGHDAGDVVLAVTGQRIRECVRAQDIVARLGGDEFAVIMVTPVDRSLVALMADRLRTAISEPVVYDGASHVVGVSIGTEFFGHQPMSVAQLIKAVDEAMYRDKQDKHNRGVGRRGAATGAAPARRQDAA